MTLTLDERRRKQLKVNRLRKKYRSQDKRINKLHGVLKHETYDYPKKFDMVTFGQEIRSYGSNNEIDGTNNKTSYLYKQKRIDGIRTHKYVAKSLEALDTKLRRQATNEVLESDGDRYALEGLAPSEVETFHFLSKECRYYKKEDRDYFAQRYIDQLKMKYSKTYERISIRQMPLQEKKNILKAARKCFQRHEKIRLKIAKMADNAKIGNNIEDFFAFADLIIMLSGGRDTPKRLENYLIKRKRELERENKWCIYSIFKDSELGDVAREIIRTSKYASLPIIQTQVYHKMKTRDPNNDDYTRALSLK
jgi:hypothetical protein